MSAIEINLSQPFTAIKDISNIYNLGDYKYCEWILNQLLMRHPDFPPALCLLGMCLHHLGQPTTAKEFLRKALYLNPELIYGYLELGQILNAERDYMAAQQSYEDMFGIFELPIAVAHHNMGNILLQRQEWDKAIAHLEKAVVLNPLARSYSLLAEAYRYKNELATAFDISQRGLKLDPNHINLQAGLAYISQRLCKWDTQEQFFAKVCKNSLTSIKAGQTPALRPFIAVVSSPDAQLNLAIARAHARERQQSVQQLQLVFEHNRRQEDAKLNIGYVSTGFQDHPTGRMIASFFKFHDRDRFKIHAYALSPSDRSMYRKQIKETVDVFYDVSALSTKDIAQRIYQDRIDILVDFDGYLAGNRMDVFALRPAPLQITYLGFPGTTGADFFDYLIADRIVIPVDQQKYYSEKIIYMPMCYQVNNIEQKGSHKRLTRKQFGLPDNAFVYCCFNVSYKIDRQTFSSWMKILKRLPDAVLWLLDYNPSTTDNLRSAASGFGIAPERLIFTPPLPKFEHLSRHQLCDVFLDTFICNAHSTASDALWAHVPLVTLQGTHFASRVAASLLTHLGLEKLVAHSPQEFEDIAVNLASDRQLLAEVKGCLSQRVDERLYNTSFFVEQIEIAYLKVWERYLEGNAPAVTWV